MLKKAILLSTEYLPSTTMISKSLYLIQQSLLSDPPERHQKQIVSLADWIADRNHKGMIADLNFICTHNSRRSQFSQVWCHIIQYWLGLNSVKAYSGGTEVTACNHRTVAALERFGFRHEAVGSQNPRYRIFAPEFDAEITLWSKTYSDDSNPGKDFAAVMTCDHADENCPFIPGAEIRVPLTYTDPKYADDTQEEESAYDLACKTIATDMLRLFLLVKEKMNSKKHSGS